MSAHSASHRRGWLSALVAQLSAYVFEEIEETVEAEPVKLEPYPVVAVVSAAPRSGATTIARLLAAELAARADGAAVVTATRPVRRTAPPSRAAIRLSAALAGAASVQPLGRLCLASPPNADVASAPHSNPGSPPHADVASAPHPNRASPLLAKPASPPHANPAAAADPATAGLVTAARYLAPVVLDLPPDGSAAGVSAIADRVAVISSAAGDAALLDAVASVVGADPVKVANRVGDPATWTSRADLLVPDSRIAARAAAMGTRPLGSLGSAVAALADALELRR